jgi:alpha-ketoglutarate-dependent 2,4-dichlorophenoxyacetate dioxygenase
MWDNRAVLHRGRRFDFAERREMRRATTEDRALNSMENAA